MNEIHQWRVPGRVNLIGDHTDHSGGLALPIAIDRSLLLKARLRDDEQTHVWSEGVNVGFPRDNPGGVTGWAAYVAGAAWMLRSEGITAPAADIVIESDVPIGAGLSSSAALSCAAVLAMSTLAGQELSRERVALLAARVENEYVGAPTGLLDQFAVCFARRDHALLLDFAEETPTVTEIPAPWREAGLVLAVIDTATRHDHATGSYRRRREEVDAARDELGLARLSEVTLDGIMRLTDPALKARAQHVFTENARVRGAANALRQGAWEQFGAMMTASHASLRDDFQVSTAELDLAVDVALERGALGARMTGGGFGGCAIALIVPERVDAVRAQLESQFAARDWKRPEIFVVHPSDGSQRLP